MSFQFPSSPTSGQTYEPSGGPVFVWDGTAWKSQTQGVPVTVYVGDNPPASPALGQLWWESDSGNLFIWYADGSSAQWVSVTTLVTALPSGEAGSIDWADVTGKPSTFPPTVPIAASDISGLGTAAVRNMHVGTTAPGSPAVNDIWIDTT